MGRLDAAAFCIILPNTPLDGAKVAAARLRNTASGSLHGTGIQPDGIVSAEPLGYPEDREAIDSLLPPATEEPIDRRA
jgi:GGDEF domain-containing protein